MNIFDKYQHYLALNEREYVQSNIVIQHPVDLQDFENLGFNTGDFRDRGLIKYGYLITNIRPPMFFHQGYFYLPGHKFPIDPEDIQEHYGEILYLFRDKLTSTFMKILYGFEGPLESMISLIFSGRLSKLPDDLYVHGDLILRNCKNLKTLPRRLVVIGKLDIRGTGIKSLPDDLQAGEILSDFD